MNKHLITSWSKCCEGNTQEIVRESNGKGELETYSDQVVRSLILWFGV